MIGQVDQGGLICGGFKSNPQGIVRAKLHPECGLQFAWIALFPVYAEIGHLHPYCGVGGVGFRRPHLLIKPNLSSMEVIVSIGLRQVVCLPV